MPIRRDRNQRCDGKAGHHRPKAGEDLVDEGRLAGVLAAAILSMRSSDFPAARLVDARLHALVERRFRASHHGARRKGQRPGSPRPWPGPGNSPSEVCTCWHRQPTAAERPGSLPIGTRTLRASCRSGSPGAHRPGKSSVSRQASADANVLRLRIIPIMVVLRYLLFVGRAYQIAARP